MRVAMVLAEEARVEAERVETLAIESAKKSRRAMWDHLAQCETGSDWTMHGDIYSSAFGMINALVREMASVDVASRILSGQASKDEQIEVAERAIEKYGPSAWGCHTNGTVPELRRKDV